MSTKYIAIVDDEIDIVDLLRILRKWKTIMIVLLLIHS